LAITGVYVALLRQSAYKSVIVRACPGGGAPCCSLTVQRAVRTAAEKPRRSGSSTATLGNDHAVVLVFVGDSALVVDVQDGDGIEPRRYAARSPRSPWVVSVQHRLDDGVLGRRQVIAEREVTPPSALVRLSQQQTTLLVTFIKHNQNYYVKLDVSTSIRGLHRKKLVLSASGS